MPRYVTSVRRMLSNPDQHAYLLILHVQEVGIKAMPTFMVFKNGEKVDTFVGADKNKLPVSGNIVSLAPMMIVTP